MFTRYTVWLAVVASAIITSSLASAADPLVGVVKDANKKVVKVFGAGGFSRLNNYGTGIVISKDGYVLTVASQILDTSDLVVHTYEGFRLKAKVVTAEPELDVALLKVQLEPGLEMEYFDFLEAAKRPHAEPGDWVIAMSNTFEIALREEPLSVQRGVVSAYTKMAGRRGVFEFPYTGDVYVVDAITNNPGAAGGALLNRKGELIGIVGRELKNSQSETWMNYAVPITAKADVKQLVPAKDKDGKPIKDKDGKDVFEEKTMTVTMSEFVTLGIQGKYKPIIKDTKLGGTGGFHGIIFVPDVLERTPAYIEDVVPGSPAEKAGLRADDLVSFIDGEPVVSIKAFNEYIKKNTRAGTVIQLEVRRGESLESVKLTLDAPPVKPKTPTPPPPPKP
jgi:S1-C subfamily serine protease